MNLTVAFSELPPILAPLLKLCESYMYVIKYMHRLRVQQIVLIHTTMRNIVSILCNVSWFYIGCINASVYGINCDNPCPTNCKDSTCHIQSGACFNCTPGWTGVECNTSKMTNFFRSEYFFLWYIIQISKFYFWINRRVSLFFFWTECQEKWYGLDCSKQCVGQCRDNATCNHVTGQCDGGCDAGWSGYMCDKGIWPWNINYCIKNCQIHCQCMICTDISSYIQYLVLKTLFLSLSLSHFW